MIHPFNSLKQSNIAIPPPKIGEGFGDFDMRYRAAPTRALRWRILFWPPPRGVSRRKRRSISRRPKERELQAC